MNLPSDRAIEVIRCGAPVAYDEAYRRQVARRKAVEQGTGSQALYLMEHQPVYTLGRDTKTEHLLRSQAEYAALGIDLQEVDRGGDVTYHGPGQLTAYPILNLSYWRQSVRWYLRTLEEVIIRTLAAFDIDGHRVDDYTGVFVGDAKVAQIGVGIRRWVTFHGIALNVNPTMAHFGLIVPCGIKDKEVTSIAEILGEAPSLDTVSETFSEEFLTYFEKWSVDSDPVAPVLETAKVSR